MIATKKILDPTDKAIIKKLKEGKLAKEIGRDLNLKHRHVSYRIAEMKKYYNCSSLAQLAVTLKKKKAV